MNRNKEFGSLNGHHFITILDTSSIAIDASKVNAAEKSVPRKNIKDDGQAVNRGSKLDTNSNQITWFGYKLHIATTRIILHI